MKKGKLILDIESEDDTLVRVAISQLDLVYVNAVLRPYIKDVTITAIKYDTENNSA